MGPGTPNLSVTATHCPLDKGGRAGHGPVQGARGLGALPKNLLETSFKNDFGNAPLDRLPVALRTKPTGPHVGWSLMSLMFVVLSIMFVT